MEHDTCGDVQCCRSLCDPGTGLSLAFGNEARINEPSTLGDNWKWRMKKGQLNETIIQKIYKMTKLYGRLVKEETEEKEKTEADREKISDK